MQKTRAFQDWESQKGQVSRGALNRTKTFVTLLAAAGSPMSSAIAREVIRVFQKPAPSAAVPEPTAGGVGSRLSSHETELFGHLAQGLAYNESAEVMGVSLKRCVRSSGASTRSSRSTRATPPWRRSTRRTAGSNPASRPGWRPFSPQFSAANSPFDSSAVLAILAVPLGFGPCQN
jgi:hypothetical protein